MLRGAVSPTLCPPPSAARVLISPAAEVLEGDDVSLTCEVPGEPQEDATFSWYKDSKSLQDSPSRVLELPHVTSAAAGSYHCKAHGPAGTGASISPAISLRVLCEWARGRHPWGHGGVVGTRHVGWDVAPGAQRGAARLLLLAPSSDGPRAGRLGFRNSSTCSVKNCLPGENTKILKLGCLGSVSP